MKRPFILLACLLGATAAFAQDVDFGAFSDPGSMLTPMPAAPARGNAPSGNAARPVPPPDRLNHLRDALLKAEAPLTREQEAELNKLLDQEIPAMRKSIQTHGQQMMAARAPVNSPGVPATPAPTPAPAVPPSQSTPAPAPPAAATRGGVPNAPGAPNPAALAAALAARGAPPSSRVPPEILDALEVEMTQLNDELFGKIAASPALDAKQQSVLTRMARNQVKSRGGFGALRIAMEDAGTPFSEEQLPKVQALFDEQKETRATLAKESQGTPDPAALKQLERDTLAKVVALLVPAQRTALLALLRSQQ